MQTRRLRLGDVVDDYCPRERRLSNHVVVAMVEDAIKQTRCSTCDFEHPYKDGKLPARRKKKDATEELYQQVLEGMSEKPPSAPVVVAERPAVAEPPARVAEPMASAAPAAASASASPSASVAAAPANPRTKAKAKAVGAGAAARAQREAVSAAPAVTAPVAAAPAPAPVLRAVPRVAAPPATPVVASPAASAPRAPVAPIAPVAPVANGEAPHAATPHAVAKPHVVAKPHLAETPHVAATPHAAAPRIAPRRVLTPKVASADPDAPKPLPQAAAPEAGADHAGDATTGAPGGENEPLHRRTLIRATLPRPVGEVPTRQAPTFTIREAARAPKFRRPFARPQGGQNGVGNSVMGRPGARNGQQPRGGKGGAPQGAHRFGQGQGQGQGPGSGGGHHAKGRPGNPGKRFK